MISPNKTLRTLLAVLCAASALFAFWQFYRFVQFRNAAGGIDPQGGTASLWIAIAAAVIACAAGGYVAFSSVTHDGEDVMHITS